MNKTACSFLISLISFQEIRADVGDFAPLQVGNVWRYVGDYLWMDDVMQSNSYSVVRRVEVLSLGMQTDTLVYRVSALDSLNRRMSVTSAGGRYDTAYYPDSVGFFEVQVMQFPDSSLGVRGSPPSDEMIRYAFRSHTYPDSLVQNGVMADSSGDLPRNWADCTFNYSVRMHLQDVGMGGYRYQQAMCVGGPRLTYNLYSFNGRIVTAIGRKLVVGKRSFSRPGIIDLFGRNILGRKIPDGTKQK
jgi:hypothetical protein